jgi:hypothetical protein
VDQQAGQILVRSGGFHGRPQAQHGGHENHDLPLQFAVGVLGSDASESKVAKAPNNTAAGSGTILRIPSTRDPAKMSRR